MGTDEPGNADTHSLCFHSDMLKVTSQCVCVRVCSCIAECLHTEVWLTHRSPEQYNSSITMLSVCSVYDNIHRFLQDTGINSPSCESRACPDAWTTSQLLKLLLSFFLAFFLLLALCFSCSCSDLQFQHDLQYSKTYSNIARLINFVCVRGLLSKRTFHRHL